MIDPRVMDMDEIEHLIYEAEDPVREESELNRLGLDGWLLEAGDRGLSPPRSPCRWPS